MFVGAIAANILILSITNLLSDDTHTLLEFKTKAHLLYLPFVVLCHTDLLGTIRVQISVQLVNRVEGNREVLVDVSDSLLLL